MIGVAKNTIFKTVTSRRSVSSYIAPKYAKTILAWYMKKIISGADIKNKSILLGLKSMQSFIIAVSVIMINITHLYSYSFVNNTSITNNLGRTFVIFMVGADLIKAVDDAIKVLDINDHNT